jgi:hypothetical protein
MGFELHLMLESGESLVVERPVVSTVVIEGGDAVKLTDGRFDLAASGEAVFGVCITLGETTGDAGGTEKVRVLATRDSVWKVADGGLDPAALEPGDSVDIGADSASIAAAANNDLRIWPSPDTPPTGYCYVYFLNRQFP